MMSSQAALDRLARHALARDALLHRITHTLENDSRFVAAWLTGSLAWGTADAWSDLDLHAVIADEQYERVVADRQRLYEQFGAPALVQSIKVNTESPAHFNLLIYPDGLEVDCSLWTTSLAHRPSASQLLFDRVGIPVDPVPTWTAEDRRREAEHQLNFFWAMATIAMKCVGRRYTAGAVFMIDSLMIGAYDCLWRLLWRPDEPHPELIAPRHRRRIPELDARMPRLGADIDLATALTVTRALCVGVVALHPALAALGVPIPAGMPDEVATLGELAEAIGIGTSDEQ
jgi:hypothetical protein